MLSEIRDGHTEVPEIGRHLVQGCIRFSPAECVRAEMAEAQPAPAGKNSSTTECETRRAGPCAWLRPSSGPKPDRGRGGQDAIVRCASRTECKERRRRADSRFFLHA